MSASNQHRTRDSRQNRIIENPDIYANSLANVITKEGQKESVLGQAWLASKGCFVTCGHVVEHFAANPAGVFLKFPASGNVYPISGIRLHPSFVRQPDQLVKFDLATIEVQLGKPESEAEPLPFSFEQELKINQDMWAIRYPAHLGQLSAVRQPLTQNGRFLGFLRKHDSFHLLHDLPLSPGDSGSAITDGTSVIAIHCGDTATLPGLNLPATSIRLSLWIDALRDMGIHQTHFKSAKVKKSRYVKAALFLLIGICLSSFVSWQLKSQELEKRWSVIQPRIRPVRMFLNRPLHGFTLNQDIEITLVPSSDCCAFLVQIDTKDNAAVLYPQFGISPFLKNGESRTINYFGRTKLTANPSPDKWHLIVVDTRTPAGKEAAASILRNEDWPASDREGRPLSTKGTVFLERLHQLKQSAPGGLIMHTTFDSPTST